MSDNKKHEFTMIKKGGQAGLLTPKNEAKLTHIFDLDEEISDTSKYFGWKFLDAVYSSFGISSIINSHSKTKKFQYDLYKVCKLMVYQRYLNPDSKLKTVESQKSLYGDWDIKLADCYRSLDELALLQEKIQNQMHKVISKDTKKEATLVFYDVTNYYFETDFNNADLLDENGDILYEALRKPGPSKEKKPKPIVQLGMFVDNNGIPISYKLFPGNNTDPITYIPAIEQVKKQFGIERVVTVADKAMNSAKNITATNEVGDGWIFSSKIRGSRGVPKELQKICIR